MIDLSPEEKEGVVKGVMRKITTERTPPDNIEEFKKGIRAILEITSPIERNIYGVLAIFKEPRRRIPERGGTRKKR